MTGAFAAVLIAAVVMLAAIIEDAVSLENERGLKRAILVGILTGGILSAIMAIGHGAEMAIAYAMQAFAS
ncbi:MAG: hypothetical protein LDL44_12560 [Caenispirillum sp.]|nr:hypothetical protein [Caenispirillum sp.]